MKAILISIKPQWVAKILNGEKTIEIRKRFPKDYVGWVYIYCTKDRKEYDFFDKKGHYQYSANGKVVARFWCNNVEEIKYHFGYYNMGEWTESYILENSCLTAEELDNYLQASKEYDEKKISRVYGYAIHITKLEIFDKPKEISDFYKAPDEKYAKWCRENSVHGLCIIQSLTRAPQSWCYVEVVR